MRKIFSVFLALILTSIFCSCSSDSGDDDDYTADKEDSASSIDISALTVPSESELLGKILLREYVTSSNHIKKMYYVFSANSVTYYKYKYKTGVHELTDTGTCKYTNGVLTISSNNSVLIRSRQQSYYFIGNTYTSGSSSLYSTFSYSYIGSDYSESCSYTFSPNGIATYSETIIDSLGTKEVYTLSGTFKNENGVITISGTMKELITTSNSTLQSDDSYENTLTVFYDNSSVYDVQPLSVVQSLPS